MSDAYERKLDDFVVDKTFMRLSRPVRDRADAQCDACGSLEPRILYGLKEENTDRCFFVGAECLRKINQRGAVKRRFCRERSRTAFDIEMSKRQTEIGAVAIQAETSPEPRIEDTASGANAMTPYLRPQVSLWETPETYVALVQMSRQGEWVWASASTSRFEQVWEGCGDSEVVFKQVHRERPQAAAECVREATESALAKLHDSRNGCSHAPSGFGNGHHDWTPFWTAVRELGLERNELVELIDGVMPRDWLDNHPECTLDDLLKVVQGKRELGIARRTAGNSVDTVQV